MGVMRIKIGNNVWKELSFEEGDGEAITKTVEDLSERVEKLEDTTSRIIIEED